MKIINAMFSKVNGGLEQVFLNYTPTLKKMGNEVISVIHPKAQIKSSCSQENLVLIHNFNQHDFVAIHRLKRLIHLEQPECIITHSYRASYLFDKTKTKVPKIAVCHVNSHFNFGADAIIALTESMRQSIIQAGHPKNTVFTVPNMIHIPEGLTYHPPLARQIPVIGACARFSEIKGIDILIHALAELKQRRIPFKVRIAGDGPEKQRYIQLIQTLGLQEDIELLGWIEDKQAFYSSLDIFCLPSREETFGLVILEAMMHSLPMVLTDVTGPKEIIAHSDSALLVPPCDPIRMADSLERIIRDHQLAQELAFNAFKRVQDYSCERVGPILQSALDDVCRA